MEKYISSVKDLVLEILSKSSLIRTSADRGDAESCFKMGMVHLLGIDTAIDFKKSTDYFSNQSLADNHEARLLLGFIAECEGHYSSAFQNYAKTSNSEKDSYFEKVTKGRNSLQTYFKKLDLPMVLNKEISELLNAYSKGKASKTGACVKIAAICNDSLSCIEAAKSLIESKDYISAMQWLHKGKVDINNQLYDLIYDKFEKSKNALLSPKDVQVIELEGNSLLSIEDPTPFLNKTKKACEDASKESSSEWKDKNKKRIGTIIRIQKEKEEKEYQQREAEEAAKERRKKKIIKHSAICIVLFIIGVAVNKEGGSGSEFISGITMILTCYFWFYLLRWVWKKIFK